MQPSTPSHSFRYEPELCDLDEGQTLSQWRRDRQEVRAARPPRRSLRSRLRAGLGRTSGR